MTKTASDRPALVVGNRYIVNDEPYFTLAAGNRVTNAEDEIREGDEITLLDLPDEQGDVTVRVDRSRQKAAIAAVLLAPVPDEAAPISEEDIADFRETLGLNETLSLSTVEAFLVDMGQSPLQIEMMIATLLRREALDHAE